jgi:hypothetical protein
LNSWLNLRLSLENSDTVETPWLGVHETGDSPMASTRHNDLLGQAYLAWPANDQFSGNSRVCRFKLTEHRYRRV